MGDAVQFDDTLTNDFVNPQPTNINLTGTFYPYPVTVDSTLPYSFTGVGGITGPTYLLKTNSGSLTLLTSNSFTGGLSINGGSVIITNDFSLGANASVVTLNGGTLQVNGNTTNNVRAFSVPATCSIGVATNVNRPFRRCLLRQRWIDEDGRRHVDLGWRQHLRREHLCQGGHTGGGFGWRDQHPHWCIAASASLTATMGR